MRCFLLAVSVVVSALHLVSSRYSNCGKPTRDVLVAEQALIRNGRTSAPGDFPWAAALYLKNNSDQWDQSCGGTLISHHLVITAAHCVVLPAGKVTTAQDLRVKLGQIARDFYKTETHSVVATVKSIVSHTRYLGSVQYFAQDVAILELTDSVPISDYIRPVCLDLGQEVELVEGKTLFISGWGTNEFDTPPAFMQWTTQTYIEYDTCKKQLDDLRFITPDKYCVESVGDSGAGKGDSGGGVTLTKNGVHYLVGVISTRLSNVRKVLGTTSLLDVGHIIWLKQTWQRLRRVQWVPGTNGTVPPGAVVAGRDNDGSLLYAGRTTWSGEVYPTKINPKYKKAYFVWYNPTHDPGEYLAYNYEVLVNEKVGWVDYVDKKLPRKALAFGKTKSNEVMYMGRALHQKSITPGRLQLSANCTLYIGFNGTAVCKDFFSVMVLLT